MRELTVSSGEENLPLILDAMDGELETAGVDGKTRMRLQIAVEEIYVNIVRHAFPGNEGEVAFRIWLEREPSRIALQLRDSGIPFDPTAKEEPDVTLPADQREVGGLGIFLAKKNVDRMEYEYRDGHNILTMYKSF